MSSSTKLQKSQWNQEKTEKTTAFLRRYLRWLMKIPSFFRWQLGHLKQFSMIAVTLPTIAVDPSARRTPLPITHYPPRCNPRKCQIDTWNTHQIPKNLSNPLLFALKSAKNRCSSIAISEKLPTFALAFRKGAQNEIFERLRTRRKRQGSAAWKRAAKRCQFL